MMSFCLAVVLARVAFLDILEVARSTMALPFKLFAGPVAPQLESVRQATVALAPRTSGALPTSHNKYSRDEWLARLPPLPYQQPGILDTLDTMPKGKNVALSWTSEEPHGMCLHADIPHFVADSTVASALDETTNAGDGPAGPKWDLAVRTEGSRFPQARIVAQSGTSFCMSGAVMKKHQMKDWVGSMDLGTFDLVFVVPMVNSVPAARDSYGYLQEFQTQAWPDAKALPTLMEWDAHLSLYAKQKELHMPGCKTMELLSIMLQLLPNRRCLVLMVGYNTNKERDEFLAQRQVLAGKTHLYQNPMQTCNERSGKAFLKNLAGARFRETGTTWLPCKWFMRGGEGVFGVAWASGTLVFETEQCPCASVLELYERYLWFLNGASEPDDEQVWKRPEEF